MRNYTDKLQYWCGVQGTMCRERAPVLEFGIGALLGGVAFALLAVSASASTAAPTDVPAVKARPWYPAIDPANALAGSELARALREGGLVLYLRHTETGAVISDECNVSNLSARGVQEAIRVGKALRTLKVPVGKILSSDICRVRETAQLLDVGKVDISEDLSNVPKRSGHDVHAGRMRLLATPPPAQANLLLAGHMHAGNSPEQVMELAFGEVIVFRPDGKGGSKAVARIRVDDWPRLIEAGGSAATLAEKTESAKP